MAQSGALERFLLDNVGYGKLGQIVQGEKPLGESVSHFMRETIFGTYGKPSAPYDVYKWNLPVVPAIVPLEGSQESPDSAKYAIESRNMFREWAPERIAEFVKEFSQRLFPSCTLSERNIGGEDENRSLLFSVSVNYNGFGISVSGYHSGIEQRTLSAHFSLPRDFAKGVNSNVSQYMQVRELPFPEPLKIFSRMDLESLSAGPVVAASLLPLIGKNNKELLNSIRESRPPLYDGGTYEPGSLIAHLHFGFGIVTGVHENAACVYFPQHSEKKLLQCRN